MNILEQLKLVINRLKGEIDTIEKIIRKEKTKRKKREQEAKRFGLTRKPRKAEEMTG
tara:strand:- start:8317 stop:8487 length:171 start_codon:yes stop_codon:yes gene_type:complete